MKKSLLATVVLAALAGPATAFANDAATPSFTGNLTVASDYRFRGISQTDKQPSVQGGFDYAHASGAYAGIWNANVSGDFIAGGSLEMDLYAGYKFEPVPGLTADVGLLRYVYPGAQVNAQTDYDTTELYAGASWKGWSAKYSHAVSGDVFGVAAARGSWYLDLNATLPVADKTQLTLHAGRQAFKGPSAAGASYTDWKIGVLHDAGFATLGLAYMDTTAGDVYTLAGKALGDATVVVSAFKTF